jgi:hypothetical protein
MVPPPSSTGTSVPVATPSAATLVNGSEDSLVSFPELHGKSAEEQVRESSAFCRRQFTFLQLAWLNNQLVLENRIKEGAENLLNMSLTVCIARYIGNAMANVNIRRLSGVRCNPSWTWRRTGSKLSLNALRWVSALRLDD